MEHYLDSLGLVNVGRMDPTLKIDLMYTRADNFTGKVLYEDLQEAYLHPEAAKALLQAQKWLKELYPGYSLIIYDAVRPMSVQQKMWNVVKVLPKIYMYPIRPGEEGCIIMVWRWM